MEDVRSRARALEDKLGAYLGDLGFELVELQFIPRRFQPLVRIYLDVMEDRPAAGVTHEDCVRVTREVRDFLTGEELVPGSYALEVSSPGIDRPLTTERQFRRNIGRMVQIHGEDDGGNAFVVSGRLQAAERDVVLVETSPDRTESVKLAAIRVARVLPEFRRPGSRKRGRKRTGKT